MGAAAPRHWCRDDVDSGRGGPTDDDCDNEHTCGGVAGVSVCVLRCSDDDACGGRQTCREIDDGRACL